jgi:anti-sigma regulatory factor (Ser/Thr protein kinase)
VCGVGVVWHFESDRALWAREAKRDFLATVRAHVGWQLDENAAGIIFSELLANVVIHAPGPVKIDLECDGKNVLLKFADTGPGFDFTSATMPSPRDERGRGLFIVSHYASGMQVTNLDGVGTLVSASLPAILPITPDPIPPSE